MKKDEGIKNLFKNYLFFINIIPYLDEKIDILEYKLSGLGAIRYDKEHTSTDSKYIELKKHEIRDELELYYQFKQMCLSALFVLRTLLSKLSPSDAKVVSDLYIFEGKKYEEASMEKDITPSGLHKQMNKMFEEII